MKIATFNVNNVNKRLANLLQWLSTAQPDVACLQELKAEQTGFPLSAIEQAGYSGVWRGQKSWNGVALLARGIEPIVTHHAMPGDPADKQSRYIEAAVGGVLIASLYAPNGNPQPGPPEPRALFQHLLNQGWTDAIRTMHPDVPMYTFWDYKRNRWARDAGLRIDHLLLNRHAANRLVDSGVDREVRGLENASDHAPAWIVLADRKKARSTLKQSSVKGRKWSTKTAARQPLLAIDGDSFAHRAYHALPKTILRRGRKPAGAILGFANLLLRLYREEAPRAVLVGWDTLEASTYRHDEFPAYQSGREFDDALLEQLDLIPKFVAACGFQNAKAPGFEADDFLAAAAAAEERLRGVVLIASGDRDTFQLASNRTTILYPARGQGMTRVDPAEVRARYGVDPGQVPDFIALRGDPSDKLPGAPGVGAVGAATLLQRFGSLEGALKAGRFPVQAESLRLFRRIATMDRKAPLPSLRNQVPTWGAAAELARNWELNQLAGRLDELAT